MGWTECALLGGKGGGFSMGWTECPLLWEGICNLIGLNALYSGREYVT